MLALGAAFLLAGSSIHAAQDSSPSASSHFTVYVRAVPVGTEEVSVERTSGGWTIVGNGRADAPVDIATRRMQIRYDADWKPLDLNVDTTTRGQVTLLRTTVTGTTVRNEMSVDGTASEKTDTIDPGSILLPNPLFGAYEALSARLRAADVGSTIPAYVAPQGSLSIVVRSFSNERIQTLTRVIDARLSRVTMNPPGGVPLDVEVWGDESGRLLRVSVPAQNLDVMREDIASVSTRRLTVFREGDEQVRIPANGFSLAGTISKPQKAGAARLPAVILAGGSGPSDRDETAFGIPIFGQLANALADAGFLVLRYDKRGVGQSGGRPESATIEDYAEDLRAAVRLMSDRRDVDRRRVAVVGHSEGGSVAMIAAERDRRITALALVATIGVTGAELNMAQVTRALERARKPEAETLATIELQKKIQRAVLTDQGWDDIPTVLRRQADTPWFRSFLAFDPARTMREIEQPVLVVQGVLDTQVALSNADRLAELARARNRKVPVEVVKIPGVNHLLVPATTGEVEEYATLTSRQISPDVPAAIAGWLQKTFAAMGR
jgi:hypothetical protein